MENKKEQLDEFLKKQMSSEHLEFNEPELSLVKEARERVLARKKYVKSKNTLFSFLSTFFNIEIKLYQSGLAVLVIAMGIFYFTGRTDKSEKKLVAEYSNNGDTSRSYSVKSTMFLVKNFSSHIN